MLVCPERHRQLTDANPTAITSWCEVCDAVEALFAALHERDRRFSSYVAERCEHALIDYFACRSIGYPPVQDSLQARETAAFEGRHLREVRKLTAIEAELVVHVAATVTAYSSRILSQPHDGSAGR
jgi:hypothetical protein